MLLVTSVINWFHASDIHQ